MTSKNTIAACDPLLNALHCRIGIAIYVMTIQNKAVYDKWSKK